ncbi:TPA: glycosyltransferase WbuB, partial [Escherichia coli]
GFIHVNGEDDKLFESAQLLLSDSVLRKQLGQNANVLLKSQFSVESAAHTIEVRLEAGECV